MARCAVALFSSLRASWRVGERTVCPAASTSEAFLAADATHNMADSCRAEYSPEVELDWTVLITSW
eukprot:14856282-Heterocapsa_arctica.AAC.1